MKINRLIDELEEELCSKRGLFAKKIDVEKCAAIVEELKGSVPSTLSDVNYILDNKQKILDNADTVAKNTIKAAEANYIHIKVTTRSSSKNAKSDTTICRPTSTRPAICFDAN